MWDSITRFWNDNQSSIVVSIIVGAIFFVLGPLGLWFSGKKVRKEKTNKAKADILDLFESMLVNKENMTVSKLLTLFRAIERSNSINLSIDTDLTNLLEDLTLRFSRSKHLSADQKDQYLTQIDKLIQELNTQDKAQESGTSLTIRELPKSYKSLVEELKEEASKHESEELNKKVENIEKRLMIRPTEPIALMARIIREKPKQAIAGLIIYVIIIFLMLYFEVVK